MELAAEDDFVYNFGIYFCCRWSILWILFAAWFIEKWIFFVHDDEPSLRELFQWLFHEQKVQIFRLFFWGLMSLKKYFNHTNNQTSTNLMAMFTIKDAFLYCLALHVYFLVSVYKRLSRSCNYNSQSGTKFKYSIPLVIP